MSNSTKSHAFTLEEIMTATQNFSQKIGQGGFGSVYFGTLEQGPDIAVKALSLFSKQGVQEFLNEVISMKYGSIFRQNLIMSYHIDCGLATLMSKQGSSEIHALPHWMSRLIFFLEFTIRSWYHYWGTVMNQENLCLSMSTCLEGP